MQNQCQYVNFKLLYKLPKTQFPQESTRKTRNSLRVAQSQNESFLSQIITSKKESLAGLLRELGYTASKISHRIIDPITAKIEKYPQDEAPDFQITGFAFDICVPYQSYLVARHELLEKLRSGECEIILLPEQSNGL